MKNKILILSLLLFSVFLIPSNVFANSIKVQFEDYSLNFTEEERQKAIDSILSNTVLNNYSKDDYYYTILYTASYKNIIINSVDDELQKRSTYILLITPKAWNNGRSLLINSSNRFDISASNAYYFDSDFINLGEYTGSIYHYLDISKNTDNYSVSFPLLYTSSDIIYNDSGYNFDYYAHCLKNEYENSGEDIKQIFEPQETYTDEGLLEYSITAKTEDLNGVDNIVNKFVQMREKAGSHYNYSWNVKIQIDDISQKIISFEDTEESITRRVKCNYVISRVDSDNTSMLTKAEIERYYKPYSLKLLVNNEQIFTKYSKPSIEQNVLYNYLEEMYDVPIVCFENVDGVQIVYDSNDNATEITYKNKTYKIQRASLDLENNIIPDAPNTETLKQILGAKFEFDFEKRTLNIVVE